MMIRKGIHTLCILKVFLLTLFFAGWYTTDAAFVYQQENPAEVYPLQSIEAETIYGRLDGAPHTFTFAVSEASPLAVRLQMSPSAPVKDVSFILVKQERRGVSEVGRVNGKEEQWQEVRDTRNAIFLLKGKQKEFTLEKGTYKLEISSPENNRGYRLTLGEGKSSLIKELWYTREIFQVSLLSMLLSPLLFVPLLCLIGVLIVRKILYRKYG